MHFYPVIKNNFFKDAGDLVGISFLKRRKILPKIIINLIYYNVDSHIMLILLKAYYQTNEFLNIDLHLHTLHYVLS